jgi:signal peptidase I
VGLGEVEADAAKVMREVLRPAGSAANSSARVDWGYRQRKASGDWDEGMGGHSDGGHEIHPALLDREPCRSPRPSATWHAKDGKRRRQSEGWRQHWRGLLIILLLAWILRSLIAAPFSIPSGSMLPGLYVGDYLLVSKWNYGYSRASFLFGFPPIRAAVRQAARTRRRGGVPRPAGNDVIKRVIGLPGDTVGTSGGRVVLNGRAGDAAGGARSACRSAPTARAGPCSLVAGQ